MTLPLFNLSNECSSAVLTQDKEQEALRAFLEKSKIATPSQYMRMLKEMTQSVPSSDTMAIILEQSGPFNRHSDRWSMVRQQCIGQWVTASLADHSNKHRPLHMLLSGIHQLSSKFAPTPSYMVQCPTSYSYMEHVTTNPAYQKAFDELIQSSEWTGFQKHLPHTNPSFQVFVMSLALHHRKNFQEVLKAVDPHAVLPPHFSREGWSVLMDTMSKRMSYDEKVEFVEILSIRMPTALMILAHDMKEVFKKKIHPSGQSAVQTHAEMIDALSRQWNFEDRCKILEWGKRIDYAFVRTKASHDRKALSAIIDPVPTRRVTKKM